MFLNGKHLEQVDRRRELKHVFIVTCSICGYLCVSLGHMVALCLNEALFVVIIVVFDFVHTMVVLDTGIKSLSQIWIHV